jgi:hypothetical protein
VSSTNGDLQNATVMQLEADESILSVESLQITQMASPTSDLASSSGNSIASTPKRQLAPT